MEDRTNPNSEIAACYELSRMGFKNVVLNDKNHLHENSKRDQIDSKDIYFDKENGKKGFISVKGTSHILNNSGTIEMYGMLRCARRSSNGGRLEGYSDDFEKALLGFIDYWVFSCRRATDAALGFFLVDGKHLKNFLKFKVDKNIYGIEDTQEWTKAIKNWARMIEDKIWDESNSGAPLRRGGNFRVKLDPKQYKSAGNKGNNIEYECKVLSNDDGTFSPFVLIPLKTKNSSFMGDWHFYSKEAIDLLRG